MIVSLIFIWNIYVCLFHRIHKKIFASNQQTTFKSVDDAMPMGYMQENDLQKDENNIDRIIQRHIFLTIIK